MTGASIGAGEAAYGEKGSTWIKMHSIASFSIFKPTSILPTDVG